MSVGARAEGGHRPFEQIERAVEDRIVAAVLDHAAGVRDGGAITAEQPARFGEGKAATDMGEIHGHLSRQRHPGAASRGSPQVMAGDAEHLDDGLLDGFARNLAGPRVRNSRR